MNELKKLLEAMELSADTQSAHNETLKIHMKAIEVCQIALIDILKRLEKLEAKDKLGLN